ncbi:hypothetical protein [Streptomyces sp. NPDC047046]|uniref:hypothetical protein n=1 Tax=Streptomyces sp. NPDC047046 TaxID=3155378 RepID=UPI00340331AE
MKDLGGEQEWNSANDPSNPWSRRDNGSGNQASATTTELVQPGEGNTAPSGTGGGSAPVGRGGARLENDPSQVSGGGHAASGGKLGEGTGTGSGAESGEGFGSAMKSEAESGKGSGTATGPDAQAGVGPADAAAHGADARSGEESSATTGPTAETGEKTSAAPATGTRTETSAKTNTRTETATRTDTHTEATPAAGTGTRSGVTARPPRPSARPSNSVRTGTTPAGVAHPDAPANADAYSAQGGNPAHGFTGTATGEPGPYTSEPGPYTSEPGSSGGHGGQYYGSAGGTGGDSRPARSSDEYTPTQVSKPPRRLKMAPPVRHPEPQAPEPTVPHTTEPTRAEPVTAPALPAGEPGTSAPVSPTRTGAVTETPTPRPAEPTATETATAPVLPGGEPHTTAPASPTRTGTNAGSATPAPTPEAPAPEAQAPAHVAPHSAPRPPAGSAGDTAKATPLAGGTVVTEPSGEQRYPGVPDAHADLAIDHLQEVGYAFRGGMRPHPQGPSVGPTAHTAQQHDDLVVTHVAKAYAQGGAKAARKAALSALPVRDHVGHDEKSLVANWIARIKLRAQPEVKVTPRALSVLDWLGERRHVMTPEQLKRLETSEAVISANISRELYAAAHPENPGTAAPARTEPARTEPAPAEPAPAEPVSAEPVATEPETPDVPQPLRAGVRDEDTPTAIGAPASYGHEFPRGPRTVTATLADVWTALADGGIRALQEEGTLDWLSAQVSHMDAAQTQSYTLFLEALSESAQTPTPTPTATPTPASSKPSAPTLSPTQAPATPAVVHVWTAAADEALIDGSLAVLAQGLESGMAQHHLRELVQNLSQWSGQMSASQRARFDGLRSRVPEAPRRALPTPPVPLPVPPRALPIPPRALPVPPAVPPAAPAAQGLPVEAEDHILQGLIDSLWGEVGTRQPFSSQSQAALAQLNARRAELSQLQQGDLDALNPMFGTVEDDGTEGAPPMPAAYGEPHHVAAVPASVAPAVGHDEEDEELWGGGPASPGDAALPHSTFDFDTDDADLDAPPPRAAEPGQAVRAPGERNAEVPETPATPAHEEPLADFVEAMRPLREYVQQHAIHPASEAPDAPASGQSTHEVEVVLGAHPGSRTLAEFLDENGHVGHAFLAVRLPGRPEPLVLGFGPMEDSSTMAVLTGYAAGSVHSETEYDLLDPTNEVLVTYRFTPEQLTRAYLYAERNFDSHYGLFTYNCVIFARDFIAAGLGRDVVPSGALSPNDLIAALRAGQRHDWAGNPHVLELTDEDQELLAAAADQSDEDAWKWAKYRVALDHQRPLVGTERSDTQARQITMLADFATMIAAAWRGGAGEAEALRLSTELGQRYGTLRALAADPLEIVTRGLRPLAASAERAAPGGPRVEVVVMGDADGHPAIEVYLPGQSRPVGFRYGPLRETPDPLAWVWGRGWGPGGIFLEHSQQLGSQTTEVLASFYVEPERLAEGYLYTLQHADPVANADSHHPSRHNGGHFVRGFLQAVLGEDLLSFAEGTDSAFIDALRGRTEHAWADGEAPFVPLSAQDRRTSADRSGDTPVDVQFASKTWARLRVAVDHQRPVFAGRGTPEQRVRVGQLEDIILLIAHTYRTGGIRLALAESFALGRQYGTWRWTGTERIDTQLNAPMDDPLAVLGAAGETAGAGPATAPTAATTRPAPAETAAPPVGDTPAIRPETGTTAPGPAPATRDNPIEYSPQGFPQLADYLHASGWQPGEPVPVEGAGTELAAMVTAHIENTLAQAGESPRDVYVHLSTFPGEEADWINHVFSHVPPRYGHTVHVLFQGLDISLCPPVGGTPTTVA